MAKQNLSIVVIGGGAGGLVALKYLAHAHEYYPIEPIDVKLFELRDEIGGVFAYQVWKGAEMVSSKYLTAFSDFRLPLDAPDFLPTERFRQYLLDYADLFQLRTHIHCGHRVTKVTRGTSNDQIHGHTVTIENRKTTFKMECDAVVVASGLHVNPVIPKNIPGLVPNFGLDEKKGCRVIHSSEFQNNEGDENEFKFKPSGNTVVVLGAGETGHDIAYCAVNNPAVDRVIMCHRNGFVVYPKIVPWPIVLGFWGRPYAGQKPNKPIDTSNASLFDTMYVPPVLQRSQVPWDYHNSAVKTIFSVISGTNAGIDQWAGKMPRERHHLDSFFPAKTLKALPYISAPFRGGSGWTRPLHRLRSFLINVPIAKTNGRVIELASWPTAITTHRDRNGEAYSIMYFPEECTTGSDQMQKSVKEKEPVCVDVVVVASGYERVVSFLGDSYPRVEDAKVRGVYRDIEDGIAFIGFSRPSVGAIPPLTELQAQLWASRFIEYKMKANPALYSSNRAAALPPRVLKSAAIPAYDLDYSLHSRGEYDFGHVKGGVDQESYAFQLALDMGAAPSASWIWKNYGWKVLYTWAMGPNFNTKFRLCGPWARPAEAKQIIEEELYPVVRRTGGLVFLTTYTIIPMLIFGMLSMLIYAYQGIADGVRKLFYSSGTGKTAKGE